MSHRWVSRDLWMAPSSLYKLTSLQRIKNANLKKASYQAENRIIMIGIDVYEQLEFL